MSLGTLSLITYLTIIIKFKCESTVVLAFFFNFIYIDLLVLVHKSQSNFCKASKAFDVKRSLLSWVTVILKLQIRLKGLKYMKMDKHLLGKTTKYCRP